MPFYSIVNFGKTVTILVYYVMIKGKLTFVTNQWAWPHHADLIFKSCKSVFVQSRKEKHMGDNGQVSASIARSRQDGGF